MQGTSSDSVASPSPRPSCIQPSGATWPASWTTAASDDAAVDWDLTTGRALQCVRKMEAARAAWVSAMHTEVGDA